MSTESQQKGYEVSDVRIRPIVMWTGALLVLVVLSYLIVAGLGPALSRDRADLSPLFDRRKPESPLLQANPRDEITQHRRYEHTMTEEYGWVQPGQIARVPVRRGMEIMLKRGFPVRKDASAGSAVEPSNVTGGGGI